MTDPFGNEPDAAEHDGDVYATDKHLSESSGVAAGASLASNPDQAVDVDDDEAVARALTDGRRDLIDVSRMSTERRMRFGLLTKEDDEKRVRGELGDYASTGDGAARTNIYENKPGSEE